MKPFIEKLFYGIGHKSKNVFKSALASAILLAACSDSRQDAGMINNKAGYLGLWLAEPYGKLVEISALQLKEFDYTRDYCLLNDNRSITLEQLAKEGWKLSSDKRQLQLTETSLGTSYRYPAYTRITTKPETCSPSSLITPIGQPGYQANPQRDFEIFWQTFDDYYLSFDLKSVDWLGLYKKYRPLVDAETTEEELLDVLDRLIKPLKDAHVSVENGKGDALGYVTRKTIWDTIQKELERTDATLDEDELWHRTVRLMESVYQIKLNYAFTGTPVWREANGRLTWFITEDNIGVLIIDQMYGFIEDNAEREGDQVKLNLSALDQALNSAMTDLQSTQGLIVDIRDNPGGHDVNSQLIMKRFLEHKRHLYSKQARLGDGRSDLHRYFLEPSDKQRYLNKPIALLVSSFTMSAAEVFAMMMRELPNVTLIGEATQGALSDILEKSLPNGFTFGLSNEYYLTPKGEWFEHSGIPVDIHVPYGTREQRDTQRDLGIEAAIMFLTASLR